MLIESRLEEEVGATLLADELLLTSSNNLVAFLMRDETLLVAEHMPAYAAEVFLCFRMNPADVCLQVHEELLAELTLVEAHHPLLSIW